MKRHRLLWAIIIAVAVTPVGLFWLYLALYNAQTRCDVGPCGLGQPWASIQAYLALGGMCALGILGPLVYENQVRAFRAALLGAVGCGVLWALVVYGNAP